MALCLVDGRNWIAAEGMKMVEQVRNQVDGISLLFVLMCKSKVKAMVSECGGRVGSTLAVCHVGIPNSIQRCASIWLVSG